MIFRRTANGIANMHLFYRVELIAYCEGGAQLDYEQINEGSGDSDTLDVFFWQSVFDISKCTKKVHFK